MSSFFGGLGRRVGVLIYGDDRQLQKTLARTEGRLATFGRRVDTAAKRGGLGGLFGGTAQIAGAAAFGIAVKKAVDAAKNAQVILGQTQVAVNDAGIAWQQNSGRIQAAALKISKASSFDDEAVLQSFQVFVRGQKNVQQSLNLASLAADVARGRYTDLESATMLVNKAAMGQIGALRRAGIQIDKNATATQALTALQKAYGGAAVKYSNSAAGASDKLSVSIENLAENVGGPLVNALGMMNDGLSKAVDFMNGLGKSTDVTAAKLKNPAFDASLAAMNGPGVNLKKLQEQFAAATLITAPGEGAARPSGRGNASTAAAAKAKAPSMVTGVSAKIADDILNARISGNDAAIKGALQKAAAFIQRALAQKLLNRKQRESLKNDLIAFNSEIQSINDSQAQAAEDAANAAKNAADAQKRATAEAKARHKEALRKAAEASKKAAQALKDQGNALKDAALARLDAVQSNRDTMRDLTDAKDALKLAKRIGGSHGIMMAQRGLQDAELARKRSLLEQATVTPAGKTAKAGFNINGGTFHFHGVQNVKQLQAELAKLSQRSTSQSRGHSPGIPHGL